jgi:hypothetical protein
MFGIKKCKATGGLWGYACAHFPKKLLRCVPASAALREPRTVQEFVEKLCVVDESLGGVVRNEFEKDICIQAESAEFRDIGGPAVLALA